MALFLVQHGVSGTRENENEKVLSEQGKTETSLIAQVAKGYNIRPERIVHSGKKRAEQTAALYHHALSVSSPLSQIPGIGPLDEVPVFAQSIAPESNTMVVGHMPFLEKLVSYLTTGSTEFKIYQFQNSGIVCLDICTSSEGVHGWYIKWTLNPNIS